jgi:hypothetical protein
MVESKRLYVKNCGKVSGKCLKLVSKLREKQTSHPDVKRWCEVCELFNVKNSGKALVNRGEGRGKECFSTGAG